MISPHRPRVLLLTLCLGSLIAAVALSPPAAAQDPTTEAMLLVPQEIQAGGRSSVTVTTVQSPGHQPVDVSVSLALVGNGGSRTELGASQTGETGRVNFAFDVPQVDRGVYSFEATIPGLAAPLVAETTVSNAPAILLETDKPIYKPGQKIEGRALLLDNALRPRAGAVEVSIQDAKGIRVHRENLEANEFGIAPFELPLATEVNFGVWKITATADGQQSTRDIRVEHYVLPRYELGATFDRGWVLVDETISGRVDAQYFFGKPVAGSVAIEAQRFVGDWEVYAGTSGELSDGAFEFQLPAVGFVAGTPGANGLGTVILEITATDTTGHTQSTTEVITVSAAPVVLTLISKTGLLKPGIPTELLLTSEAPDGTPIATNVAVNVSFFDVNRQTLETQSLEVATANGAANVSFTPPEGSIRAYVEARATIDAHTAMTTLELAASWSPTSSFLSVTRIDSQARAEVGQELVFRATSTHQGTVYYDVYAGGRTVFSGASEDREIRFFASPEMAPSAKVVAYTINPDNEVSADSFPFEVNMPTTVSVSSTVDVEDLKPGDEITLTIDTGERAMVGLAIVDRSVLALGKSRLHLGEVFAELERRFMEPQGEGHGGHGGDPIGGGGPVGGGGPAGDGFFEPFFGNWHSPGAAEILEDIGLKLVTTPGIRMPESNDFFDFLEDVDVVRAADGPPAPAPGEGGGSEAPGEVVRVRQFFPETWVWNPTLLTDDNGLATLELTVPDSITSWSVSTVASAPSGIGFGESNVVVFQDFFVEPDLPVAVTRGEEFPVRIQIFNYLEEPQSVSLEFGSGEWFEFLGDGDLSVEVPASAAISVDFPIQPTEVGEHEVKIIALGSRLADAVIRTIRVEPEGEPVETVFNSVIESGTTVTLDTTLPDYTVSDSGAAFLHITPSPIAQTLSGISGLLNMPFGCGEQNMIFLAPDVAILRYIKTSGEVMPEIQATAEYFINVGYQRELTFQTEDGGFAAFGGKDGALWLTNFVLSTFSIAREVRDIDETVLAQAAAMILGRQKEDGSFQTDDFLIHKEMDGGLSNLFAMTAYTANALADYGDPAVENALMKAAQYLDRERTSVNDDAYALSIAAVAMTKIPGFESMANAVIERLLELAIRDGVGMHWEPYPIETTGYVAMALVAQSRPEAAGAVDWLSTQRNSLGGFGESTQDTVVAIRALTEAALKTRADLDATLTVKDGDSTLVTFTVDNSNYDLLQSTPLPIDRADGLTLSSSGTGNVGFQVAKKFYVPGEQLPPSSDMEIDVTYDAATIEVNDIVDVRVRVAYTGYKDETAMVLVDIGVPTGFETVRSTLDALVDAEIASRVDVAGRKVIVYLDSLLQNSPVEFSFQVKARYPVRAEAPVSRVYEYYDPEVFAADRGRALEIRVPSGSVEFVRGDVNSDGDIDISDPVAALNYLFRGTLHIGCEDRADINDDGNLNVTDPIALLEYLFKNGDVPPEPFGEPGEDPTDDELLCPETTAGE